jgi:hypothetical protein
MGAIGSGAPLALGVLFAVPLVRRRPLLPRTGAHDRFTGFLPDRRRWR